MPFASDIAGQVFGRLTALSIVYRNSRRHWLCRCECGQETFATAGKLKYGHKRSCGCLVAETSRRNVAPNDRVGKRYARLTVLSLAGTSGQGSRWLCRCDCGTALVVQAGNLASGAVKSCGCLMRERAAEMAHLNFPANLALKKMPPGTAASRALYKNYQRGAARRDFTFSLSFDLFLSLTTSDCSYCGVEPRQEQRGKTARYNGAYIYNGVDRVDSAQGYVAGNVVPCCRQCNMAKRTLSVAEFYGWIRRVHEKQEGAFAVRAS